MHAILIVVVALCLSPLTGTPVNAQTNDSDAIFVEAVAAVKNKDYGHAVKLFSSQAEANQHDAQYNLAVLLKAGKGAPQDFLKALTWAWAAHLGGIEAAEDLSDELLDLIPEKSIEAAREAVAKRLRARIDDGEKPAVMQFARFHAELREEADYERAYIWYSIAAAIGLDGAFEARDDTRGDVDEEKIVELQVEAGTIFETLTFD
ncbi:MAG: tetratricopeptide repeat protein [Candidatus Puniceispirillaceae bacterium]|jgi:TPR repeat protein